MKWRNRKKMDRVVKPVDKYKRKFFGNREFRKYCFKCKKRRLTIHHHYLCNHCWNEKQRRHLTQAGVVT